MLFFNENMSREFNEGLKKILRDYAEAIILALLLALFIRFFVVSAYSVSHSMMEPNLKKGDFILAYKIPFGVRLPFSDIKLGTPVARRGELVVFSCPDSQGSKCIKRIVGLPGDRIEIIGQRLIINKSIAEYSLLKGKEDSFYISLTEKWGGHEWPIIISNLSQDEDLVGFGPYVVPPGSVFLLGDNRDESLDSRSWGAIPLSALEAKAVLIWWSLDGPSVSDGKKRYFVRWDRIFERPH